MANRLTNKTVALPASGEREATERAAPTYANLNPS